MFFPAHFECDCKYKDIEIKLAGSISNKGFRAPDVYLKAYGKLPDYYITKEEAYKLGWEPCKNLAHFAPGKMIGGEPYFNKKGYLPEKEGRLFTRFSENIAYCTHLICYKYLL